MQSGNKEVSFEDRIKSLRGPVFVFGAGGFIGINLLNTLLEYRKDVYGLSQDYRNNWRLIANKIHESNMLSCDINDLIGLKNTIQQIKPQTIFNLAAYGAYSKQKEYKKIYDTNFNSTVNCIEILKAQGFSSYIHAGSSSEYGLNSSAPSESEDLIPNSHYAVSKVASYYAIKYYGKIEQLPVAHIRLYSAYGPWEEPDRFIPVLISRARKKIFPPLVDPSVSRDYIYISDICKAFILAAHAINSLKGEVLNIGTEKKTTIREMVSIISKLYNIEKAPEFGSISNRSWDVPNWYSNSEKAKKILNWKSEVDLETGLKRVDAWQVGVGFDTAFWNWNK